MVICTLWILLLNYQRVYPMNIPLNHYKIPWKMVIFHSFLLNYQIFPLKIVMFHCYVSLPEGTPGSTYFLCPSESNRRIQETTEDSWAPGDEAEMAEAFKDPFFWETLPWKEWEFHHEKWGNIWEFYYRKRLGFRHQTLGLTIKNDDLG